LGMSESEVNSTGWRGTDQGAQMKSSADDTPSWDGTNTSGFSGLAGGYRHYGNGNFVTEGYHAYIWSATISSTTSAWYRRLTEGNESVYRWQGSMRMGASVRCIKDTEQ